MSFLRRLSAWLLGSKESDSVSPTLRLTELLEKARRELYQENYPDALKDLDEASTLLDKDSNHRATFDIAFSRADVLASLGRFEEAENLLQSLRKDCETKQMKAPLAYTLASLGQVAQQQCQWEKAQNYY